MEALQALLTYYIQKYITDDSGSPTIQKGLYFDYIVTQYPDQRQEIRIYYYPDLKEYGFFKYKNKELVLDQVIKRESNNNHTELTIKDFYKRNYIPLKQ